MHSTKVELLPVTQADREAAAQLYLWFPALSSSLDAARKTAQFVRDGGADGWSSVQAFARHRISSTPIVDVMRVEKLREWRCYHCGDVFTDDRSARLHFGRDEDSTPACQIKAGAEQGLLGALRDAEYAAADAQQAVANECTDAAKAYYAQASRHAQALRNAEELGYERGLADGRALDGTRVDAGEGNSRPTSPLGHARACLRTAGETSHVQIRRADLQWIIDRFPVCNPDATSTGEGLTSGEGKTHNIKCWPDVFEEMRAGRKTAEFRYNDRGYAVGDMLLICEWDTATAAYTHREITRQITHVLDGGFGMPAGYVMLSLAASPSQPNTEGLTSGEGWKLVPPEITQAMEEAWRNAPGLSCRSAYRAMLAAAPAASPSQPTNASVREGGE